jgi:hypothetical protein
MGWRSGFPTGRPWDFALDHGLLINSLARFDPICHNLPDPVPRIASPSPHLRCSSGSLGPTRRLSRDSLPRGDSAACRTPCGVAHTDGFPRVVLAVAHPKGWRSGFPTGRPWDFAVDRLDLTGQWLAPSTVQTAAASRTLFLGSQAFRRTSVQLWPAGSDASRVAGLSPAVRQRHMRRL